MENTALTLENVIQSLDFSAITNNVLTVISVSAGFVIGLIAIRKGWGFLKSTIRKA